MSYKKFLRLFYPEKMILLGMFLILVGLVQTFFYGYTAIVDPYLKLLEEPMDKTAFGIILVLVGIVTYMFWKEFKLGRVKLGLFTLFFAFSVRTFWEINWATGAYMSSLYSYWSFTNNVSPIYPGQAWPTLDYLGTTSFYMNFILPMFAFSTAVCIFLFLSLLFERFKTRNKL